MSKTRRIQGTSATPYRGRCCMGTHYDHLCAEERGTIMAMTQAGQGVRKIARVLNRAPSSISRERRRNGWRSGAERGAMGRPTIAGGYDAKRAGQRARRLCRRARRARKLARGSALWAQVRSQLELGWSPEQIAGTLKKKGPLWECALAGLARNDLHRHLRTPQGRIAPRTDAMASAEPGRASASNTR